MRLLVVCVVFVCALGRGYAEDCELVCADLAVNDASCPIPRRQPEEGESVQVKMHEGCYCTCGNPEGSECVKDDDCSVGHLCMIKPGTDNGKICQSLCKLNANKKPYHSCKVDARTGELIHSPVEYVTNCNDVDNNCIASNGEAERTFVNDCHMVKYNREHPSEKPFFAIYSYGQTINY